MIPSNTIWNVRMEEGSVMKSVSRKDEKSQPVAIVLTKGIGVGIAQNGNPEEDQIAIRFSGENMETDEDISYVSLIPTDALQEVIERLFSVGVDYQKKTGRDIGFGDFEGEED